MSDSNIDWNAVYEQLRQSEQKLVEALSPNPERVRRIQSDRAARLASRRRSEHVEETVPMLIAEVGGERIAIDARAVSEAVRISALTPVAGAPDEILGVTNLRGELYSVMAARSFLKTAGSAGETMWGIALRHPVLRIILRVEAVHRIENVPASALAAVEGNVLRIQDEIAIVLDTRAVLERLEAEIASLTTFHDQP
jgi:chemotaxis signal transduction protein